VIRVALLVGMLLISFPEKTTAENVPPDSVVIIGNSASVPHDLSIKQLRDIYWGRDRTWDNGTPIRVYTLTSPNPTTLLFFTQYLGVLPTTYWTNIFKQDTVDIFIPIISPSESALYHSIDCNPGAIGFISGSEYNYHVNEADMVDSMSVTH